MEKHGKADYEDWEREHRDELMQMLDEMYQVEEGTDKK